MPLEILTRLSCYHLQAVVVWSIVAHLKCTEIARLSTSSVEVSVYVFVPKHKIPVSNYIQKKTYRLFS